MDPYSPAVLSGQYYLEQAIELTELFRGFEIFGQFVSQSLQLFVVHNLTFI